MTVAIKNNFRSLLLDKAKRENRRISYTDVSNETGGTPLKTVARWDKGDVTQIHSDVLERFCGYFGCEVGDLLIYIPDK